MDSLKLTLYLIQTPFHTFANSRPRSGNSCKMVSLEVNLDLQCSQNRINLGSTGQGLTYDLHVHVDVEVSCSRTGTLVSIKQATLRHGIVALLRISVLCS